ncbi:endonuclease domain-containing 1 protein-like [Catharus ustulatus]|uniref:ENDD1 protein n=1 Tax=Catharus ustulatus TaxID=91951 RepID=A0A8C3U3R6_CATUS|nr:endonuclease domain-containing 1 protein-like [Catharus ustulatus]
MLGLLLLLQVLASCLWLGHSEVVTAFLGPCAQFFYAQTPPSGALRPTNAARICQVYDNKYRFATLYDRNRRIPVYSAYIYQPGNGSRYDRWFVEPQLINETYNKNMDEEDDIIRRYQITSADVGKSQAIDQDYMNLADLDRGHLSPSSHHNDDKWSWATFTLTNIVPQDRKLNQNAWRMYEEDTMSKNSQGCDTTYVITGAVPGNTTVPSGRVNIPSYIWSAACCVKDKKPLKAWGALAENEINKNVVENLTLGRLETQLKKLYNGTVTLFSNSCTQE